MKKKFGFCVFLHPNLRKLIMEIKISILIILVSVSSLFASHTYSQTAKVSLDMQNTTLEQVMDEIERQSEFYFIFNQKQIDVKRVVNIRAEEKLISEILPQLFKETDVNYAIFDKKIILTNDLSEDELKKGLAYSEFQQLEVTGTVTDSKSGESLAGVNIVVKGTTIGAISDADGKYSINVPSLNSVLVFSFIGYATQESQLAGQRVLNVSMSESLSALEEIVVVGYGTQKKVNLTGAVDVISNTGLANRPSSTVSNMLEGLAPGITFTPGANGFEPGATLDLTIRGLGSLNGGKPYVLVDGFPGDINKLNPEDIESISVLKDAAASAIYGARAPYGVILVTTKHGKKGERMRASYSGNVSIAKPQKLPDMVDSYTWARMLNEAGANKGGQTFSNETVDRIIWYQNQEWDKIKQSIAAWPEGATIFGAYPSGTLWNNANLNYANTDWFDFHYGQAVNQKHDFSVYGGSETTSYYLSAGYLSQEGILNYATDDFRRINLLGKVDIDITKWWKIKWESNFSNRRIVRPTRGLSFINIARGYPVSPVFDGWGHYQYNSFVPNLQSGDTDSREIDQWQSFSTELTPLKGWKINADFAYNSLAGNTSAVSKIVQQYKVDNSGTVPYATTVPNSIEQSHTKNNYYTLNLYTSYNLNLNDVHNFYVMGGMQYEYGLYNTLSTKKNDLIIEDIPSLQTAVGTITASESLENRATIGYFGRFNYNYKEKYLFESNIRYDGSYVFREGNRWGLFPSFSLGWNLNNESFWASVKRYINTMKIRVSWGQLGNQNVNPYSDLELVQLQTGQLNWIYNYGEKRPIGYTTAPGIVNQNLTWETATTSNLGINMSFLKNKLMVDFDIFQRLTTDMVGPDQAKPGVLGADVPKDNNSELRTRGWELGIKWKHDLNMGLSYYLNLNLYDDRSVVTKYFNPTGTLTTWYEGKEVGEIWGYTVYDLFRSQDELTDYLAEVDMTKIAVNWKTGDLRFEDTNDNGKVSNGSNTLNDHDDLSIIGNTSPHFQYGVLAGLSYKGFDFSMLWKGVMKKDIWFGWDANLYYGFSRQWFYSHHTKETLDYFRDQPGDKYKGLYEGDANINTDAYWPRPYENQTEQAKNLNNPNTRYLANAAYLRLQNIQIGYSLPAGILRKIGIERLRISFSGENLVTFTELPMGIDAVVPTDGRLTYGADRIYSFGLSITY